MERNALVAITATFGLLLVMWCALTPTYKAPDEIAHFNSAVRLALHSSWPAPGDAKYVAAVQFSGQGGADTAARDRSTLRELAEEHPGMYDRVDQMTQHSPLYYGLAAVALHAVGFEDVRWDIDLVLLRLLNVILALPLPILIWMTVRRLTGSPRTAVVSSMALLAVPQVAQIASSVTNDALVMLLGAIVTYLAALVLTGDLRWRIIVLCGVVLGLLILTKGTGLPAVPFVAVTMLAAGTSPWQSRALRTLVAMSVAAAIGGWWWLRNIILYGNIQPSGLADVRPEAPWAEGAAPNAAVFFNAMWDGLSATFWGKFGPAQFPLSPILTDILTVLSLAVIAVFAFRGRSSRKTALVMAVFPISVFVMLSYNTYRIYVRTQFVYGTQGRYFFVALVALIALSALAWLAFLRTASSRRRFGTIVVIAAPAIAIYGLSVAYRGFFEESMLQVTREGLTHWAATSTFGIAGIIGVGLLLIGFGGYAIRQSLRFCRFPSAIVH